MTYKTFINALDTRVASRTSSSGVDRPYYLEQHLMDINDHRVTAFPGDCAMSREETKLDQHTCMDYGINGSIDQSSQASEDIGPVDNRPEDVSSFTVQNHKRDNNNDDKSHRIEISQPNLAADVNQPESLTGLSKLRQSLRRVLKHLAFRIFTILLVLVMSFPFAGFMAFYRNPIKEVARFLDTKHKYHCMVFDLCIERTYDESRFHHRVTRCRIEDHYPPKLLILLDFVKAARSWLEADPENVIAVHCKGVWERLIRKVRTVITGLLQEHGTRLDTDSLNTHI